MMFYLSLIVGFLIGGIPFGLTIGYLFGKGDIRRRGSGNIGATNVWRVAGPTAAILAFVGDIGKGILAVWLCSRLYQFGWPVTESTACLLAGILAILGHVFSPYLKFKGGKGVNTALGVFIYLLPAETLIALGVFLVVVLISRYISLGSMLSAAAFAAILWAERFIVHRPVDPIYLVVVVLLVIFMVFTHRQNIRRLMTGTENRFSLRKAAG
jgi:glycerol-3-phosphate acyltransferase PlsY